MRRVHLEHAIAGDAPHTFQFHRFDEPVGITSPAEGGLQGRLGIHYLQE